MEPFTYLRAADEARAITAGQTAGTAFVAGGTNVVDLMRLHVMRPKSLVDITGLPLDKIEPSAGGGLLIGALVSNTALAYDPRVVEKFPVLSEALLSGASPQLRNMATVGGNLLQRTRCPYFRDGVSPCNKREPGTGCAAQDGYTRSHAVLGTSTKCIATHPSDMCVALVALDAIVHTHGPRGNRTSAVADLHTAPGDHPEIESVLVPGELITHVELPATAFAQRSRYTKVRDRAAFSFALASAAIALDLRGTTVHDARIALGGVATKPWRAHEAERALIGRAANLENFQKAATVALEGAQPRGENAFKVELARRTIVRALQRGVA